MQQRAGLPKFALATILVLVSTILTGGAFIASQRATASDISSSAASAAGTPMPAARRHGQIPFRTPGERGTRPTAGAAGLQTTKAVTADAPLAPATAATPAAAAATATPRLDYYGGPVVSAAKVIQVLYGTGTFLPQTTATTGASVRSFIGEFLASPAVDWLSEYDTNITAVGGGAGTGQHIGRGTFASVVTVTPASTAAKILDVDLEADLRAQFTAGKLPAPEADANGHSNTIYSVFLPRERMICSVDSNGKEACSLKAGGFCAFHSAFVLNGKSILYTVHPDMTGLARGCGTGGEFGMTTSALSHELVETITDPLGPLARSAAPPLGWYDDVTTGAGEIGDICGGSDGTFVGTDGLTYSAQTEWSNQAVACILTKASPPPAGGISVSPASLSVVAGTSAALVVGVSATVPGPVTLTVAGLPSGVTATFQPATVNAGGSSTLLLDVPVLATAGTSTLTVSTNTGKSATAALTVVSGRPGDRGEAALDATAPVTRLVDTRATKALGPDGVLHVKTASTSATAVVINVTATAASASTYVTVWPCDQSLPVASSLNVRPGETVANLVTVQTAPNGEVCAYNHVGNTQLIMDQTASYQSVAGQTSIGRFVPATPVRALDTRETGAPFAPGEARAVDLKAVGVPANASAAVLTITGIDAKAPGYWSLWPAGGWPGTSSLNLFAAGQTRANQAVVAVSSGTVQLLSQVGGHVAIDVAGWFTGVGDPATTAGLFHPITPLRAADSRNRATGIVEARLDLSGLIPATASAVALNVTATDPVGAGFVTVYPAAAPLPLASNLNYTTGATVPVHVVVGVSNTVANFHSKVAAQIIVDLFGWYS